MIQSRASGTLSRRGALKLFGLTAGSAIALPMVQSPLRATSLPLGSTSDSLSIALLRTTGGILHDGGDAFERGLTMALQSEAAIAGTIAPTVATRTIAPGIASARRAFGEIAADRSVDLVIGLFGGAVTSRLRPIIEEHGMPFVEASLGENVARESADSRYITRSTLGAWQASWALGAWATRSFGRRSLVVTTALDGGFDTLRAWREGVREAGGDVVGVFLLDGDRSAGIDGDLGRLAAGADHIHLLVRDAMLPLALRTLEAHGVRRALPITGSALTSSSDLDASASTWYASLENRRNASFVASYRNAHRAVPSAVAALGHETGRLVAEALGAVAPTRRALAGALAGASWRGARGSVAVGTPSNSVLAPLYRRSESSPPLRLSADLAPDEADARATALRRGGFAGWLHSYLG